MSYARSGHASPAITRDREVHMTVGVIIRELASIIHPSREIKLNIIRNFAHYSYPLENNIMEWTLMTIFSQSFLFCVCACKKCLPLYGCFFLQCKKWFSEIIGIHLAINHLRTNDNKIVLHIKQ